MTKSISFRAVLAASFITSTLVACDGEPYLVGKGSVVTENNEGPSTSVADAAAPASGSSASEVDASPATPSSAGASATDVFAGAPPYVATTGPTTEDKAHPGSGNAAGTACFKCHDGNASSPMVMGGTVYSDATGKTPVSQAEVRLVVGATAFDAFTNEAGNFFVLGASVTGSVEVGVRDAVSTHTMSGSPKSGDCNSCHDGNDAPRIHL